MPIKLSFEEFVNRIKKIFDDFAIWLYIQIHIRRALKEALDGKTTEWKEFFKALEEEES